MMGTGSNGSARLEPVPSTGGSADGATGVAVDMTVLAGFEEVQVEGEPDLIVELIDLYLEDTSFRVAAVREAVANADETSLKRAAHSLKGSSANLGARQMAALCEELERLDGGGSFQIAGGALVARLEREFERARRALEAERRRRA